MSTQTRPVPRAVAAGACLSLLAVLFGFALGGAFGVIEASIKKQLDDSGSAVLQSVYKGDSAAKESLSFIAIPGAGLSILGLCGTIFSVVRAFTFDSEAV